MTLFHFPPTVEDGQDDEFHEPWPVRSQQLVFFAVSDHRTSFGPWFWCGLWLAAMTGMCVSIAGGACRSYQRRVETLP